MKSKQGEEPGGAKGVVQGKPQICALKPGHQLNSPCRKLHLYPFLYTDAYTSRSHRVHNLLLQEILCEE